MNTKRTFKSNLVFFVGMGIAPFLFVSIYMRMDIPFLLWIAAILVYMLGVKVLSDKIQEREECFSKEQKQVRLIGYLLFFGGLFVSFAIEWTLINTNFPIYLTHAFAALVFIFSVIGCFHFEDKVKYVAQHRV